MSGWTRILAGALLLGGSLAQAAGPREIDWVGPALAEAAFPLAIDRAAVALAIVDVDEGARPHAAARGRPVVLQTVGVQLAADAQQVLAAQREFRCQLAAVVDAVAQHRHAGGAGVGDRAAGPALAHAAGHVRGHAVPEAFVRTEVHRMRHILMPDAGIERHARVLTTVMQVDALGAVVGQVHALVGVVLERHVLQADACVDEMRAAAPTGGQLVVARAVGAGSHLVQRQGVAVTPRAHCPLEVPAGGVVVGLGQRAGVTQVELLAGEGERGIHAKCIAVAAVVARQLAAMHQVFSGDGETRRGGTEHDAAADAVAADADRGDPGVDLDPGHLARRHVGQRRVHVVGARGDQVGAVDLDAQAIVGQAADHRQARHAPGAIGTHARQLAQGSGGVGTAAARQGLGVQFLRAGQFGGPRAFHRDRVEGRWIGRGEGDWRDQDRQGGRQRMQFETHGILATELPAIRLGGESPCAGT